MRKGILVALGLAALWLVVQVLLNDATVVRSDRVDREDAAQGRTPFRGWEELAGGPAVAATSVRCLVVDKGDQPVVGASVAIGFFEARRGWTVVARARSDESGRALFRGLSTGIAYHFEAAAGRKRARTNPSGCRLASGPNEIVLVLLAGIQLRGRVLDAATELPVAGAAVVIASGTLPHTNNLRTGPDGTFTWEGAAGLTTVHAFATGYGESAVWRETLGLAAAGNREVELWIAPERVVAGRVLASDGSGVPDMLVSVFHGTHRRTQATDSAGRFTLHHVPSGAPLRLLAFERSLESAKVRPGTFGGMLSGRSGVFTQIDRRYSAQEDTSHLELTVARAGRIEGVVRDATGSGLGFCRVFVKPVGPAGSASWRSAPTWSAGRSDAQGGFAVSNLPPGRYALLLVDPSAFPQPLRSDSRLAPEPVMIEVAEGATVRTDLDGRDVMVLTVRWKSQPPEPARLGSIRVVAKSVGNAAIEFSASLDRTRTAYFTLPLAGAPYRVHVLERGLEAAPPRLVTVGVTEIDLDEPPARLGAVAVTVRRLGGAAVREFRLNLDGLARGVRLDLGRVFRSPEGRAFFDRAPAGVYRLTVIPTGESPHVHGSVTVAAGATVEVRVSLP